MTTIRMMLTRATMGALLFAGGCAWLGAANAAPPAPMEGQLAGTLQQAEREVLASRYGVADRLLDEYAVSHANTPEAVETGFWRALFKLDGANRNAEARDAIALLDAYLSAPVTVAHRGAATSLRRVAVALDRTAIAAPPSTARADAKPEVKPEDRPREEEITRLKEELAKANAELERIKRRLAQPNP